MAQKEWRAVDGGVLVHVAELVHGGQVVFYCWPQIINAAATLDTSPITEATVLMCLWCAAWWER